MHKGIILMLVFIILDIMIILMYLLCFVYFPNFFRISISYLHNDMLVIQSFTQKYL